MWHEVPHIAFAVRYIDDRYHVSFHLNLPVACIKCADRLMVRLVVRLRKARRSEHLRLARRYKAKKILIEDKASGTQLLQDLKREGLSQVVAYTPPAGADKIMRLHSQTAVFENGHVLLPKEAPWLAEYVRELTGFPGSRYADQVDSTTQALDYLQNTYYGASWIYRVDWDARQSSRAPPPRKKKWQTFPRRPI
jgi:predicted phage terminase large subunit-like protein